MVLQGSKPTVLASERCPFRPSVRNHDDEVNQKPGGEIVDLRDPRPRIYVRSLPVEIRSVVLLLVDQAVQSCLRPKKQTSGCTQLCRVTPAKATQT